MKPLSPLTRALLVLAVLLPSCAETATAGTPPVAQDDYIVATDRYLELVGGEERYSILIDVLANDHDPDGDRLEVVQTGEFGAPPWSVDPVGFVQYLGAGVFDLSFGKEELGDATEVTFDYELVGGSAATVRVTVAGEGPAPDVTARDDVFDEPWACNAVMPVLANDTGLDSVQSFTEPAGTVIERHPADPNVLVYRGADGATFTYTAASSITGATATATVSVQQGNRLGKGGILGGTDITLADCFERADGTDLNGEQVASYRGLTTTGSYFDWTAPGITHLDETGTSDGQAPTAMRRAYLPFYTGDLDGSAFELRSTFRADSTTAEWVALAFTHGGGSALTEADLWVRLNVQTGALFLNGRWGGGFQEKLADSVTPEVAGYPFVLDGVNYLRLRYDTEPAVPKVDVWINGVRVFSRIPHADVTGTIENVGYFINHGPLANEPGDVWFDDFELRVFDVQEAVLQPKAGHPDAGASVADGSTVDLGALHAGCTAQHTNCHSSREASLWLTNDGNEPLEVDNLTFEGPTAWSLLQPASTAVTIPAGGEAEIRVRLDALEIGATESRVELSTNDPDLPKLTVKFAAEVHPAPVADFVQYCDGLICSFDGGASSGVGLNDFGHVWSLDGASQGFGTTLDHTFATSGMHTVTLRVTDSAGAQHQLQRTIGIPPEAGFIALCGNATRRCELDAAATTEGVVSYEYRLGDGTAPYIGTGDPGDVLLMHTYATSGRYDATLTVWDEDGQEDSVTHEIVLTPVADFTASCSAETTSCELDASGSSPGMILYEWTFGDGSVGTGPQTAHAYATSGIFTVTLTVVDPAGQVEAVTKPVAVLPRAEIAVECDSTTRTCTFDGSTSTSGVDHEWDFGDGSPLATGATTLHTYATSGIFTAMLTVTDPSGQTASATRAVTIPPTASFEVSCDGSICDFDGTGSSPGMTSYAWSFGHDGATASGATTEHEFPSGGEYLVTLTVTDAAGQTANATRAVQVADEEVLLLILLDRR